ncbi:MAG: outer membrane protein assembly factor BamB family protein [Limisphaerales bacterium]
MKRSCHHFIFLILPMLSLSVEAENFRELWSRSAAPQQGAHSERIAIDHENNLFHIWRYSYTNAVLVKYAGNSGVTLWETNLNREAQYLRVHPSGDALVLGHVDAELEGANLLELYAARINGVSGEIVWQRNYRATNNGNFYSLGLELDPAGDVLALGSADDSPADAAVVLKYSFNDGTLLWEKYLTRPSPFTHPKFRIDALGSIAVADVETNRFYVAKLAGPNGAVLWETNGSISPTNGTYASDLTIDIAGNIVVTGVDQYQFGFHGRIYTAKFNGADGALIWETSESYSRFPGDAGWLVRALPGGDVVVAATRTPLSSEERDSVSLIRYTAASGQKLWDRKLDIPAPLPGYPETPVELVVASDGNLIVTLTSLNPRSSHTLNVDSTTGNILWELPHGDLFAYGVDYKPDFFAVAGQISLTRTPPSSAAIVKVYIGGPELTVQSASNGNDIEISWSENYLGWTLQSLGVPASGSALHASSLPGSHETNRVRVSLQPNGSQLFRLVR